LGEYCLVVEGANPDRVKEKKEAWWKNLKIEEHVALYEQEEGLTRKDAMKKTAADRGVSKRDIYNSLL
ncbi:16S rRNA (cytidine(1402)-2'-O)-methyltransferase, partial [Paenibacillus macerans]|nr:16S rRNA (cytidine(1402)-2'-O)-methyltransferase [Paenibacillus macerans]